MNRLVSLQKYLPFLKIISIAGSGLGFRMGYLGRVFNEIDKDFEIVGYIDPALAGLAELQRHSIGACRPYETPQALFIGESFDLLMIGSPNHLHLDHIRLELEESYTVFAEKPVVVTSPKAWNWYACLPGMGMTADGRWCYATPLYRDLRRTQTEGRLGESRVDEASEHIYPITPP